MKLIFPSKKQKVDNFSYHFGEMMKRINWEAHKKTIKDGFESQQILDRLFNKLKNQNQ